MNLSEEQRRELFQEKYGIIDLHTSYVTLSQHPVERIDEYNTKFVGEAVLNIQEYDQPFEVNFSVGLNGRFLSQIKQIFFNIKFQSFNGNIEYDQVEQQLIVSRDQIIDPVDSEGVLQLNGEIPEMVAPTRGYFTVNFIFEVDDDELDDKNPTLIGYSVCRVPVQVASGKKNG